MTTEDERPVAAGEAGSIDRGEPASSAAVVRALPDGMDVKAIRRKMNMTQVVFGLRFGFGPSRIRDWEQGRAHPTASDRVLLATIERSPETVLEAVAAAGGSSSEPLASETRLTRKTTRRERDVSPQTGSEFDRLVEETRRDRETFSRVTTREILTWRDAGRSH